MSESIYCYSYACDVFFFFWEGNTGLHGWLGA